MSVSISQPNSPPLRAAQLPLDPWLLFAEWLHAAQSAVGGVEASAMTLATVDAAGRPSARVVMMRSYDQRGLCFYTHYESRKAQELAQNPYAAAVFWWHALGRQIRCEGQVDILTPAESDTYFQSRPRGSRLSTWLSPQSQVISNRERLELEWQQLQNRYVEEDPPRPLNWGGYRLRPDSFEFWQQGPEPLHDRFRYTRQSASEWLRERLAP